VNVKEYDVEVRIAPREGLLDPQGKAIHNALHSLEFDSVESVRVGRLLRLKVHADSADDARSAADDMCRKLLANPVTEDYDIAIGATA
jgi:phosphoribosylformylglycinamidine synthase PurS subunit